MKHLNKFIKEQLITEHFLTLTKKEDMKKYGEEVWDILQKSYAYIGGIAGINSIDDLIEDTDLWKLVRRDNKITAIKAYKLKNGGRKSNCGGTDGTIQGKKDIMKIYQEDGLMKDRHQYGEYSGKAVSTVLRTGGIPVPAAIAQTILEPKKIEICQDGWFYIRKLGDGKSHHKLMVGNLPDGKYNDEKPSEELIHILKELSKKYYAEDENKKEF